MYDSTTTYVTKADYMAMFGIDLEIELRNSNTDNISRQVDIFIDNQQERLYHTMTRRYNTSNWEQNWDDDTFGKALLWYINYVLENGQTNGIDKMTYSVLRQHGMANPI